MSYQLPTEWTAVERIQAATVLLNGLKRDIAAGRYGSPSVPDITTALHILNSDPVTLNASRDDLAAMLRGGADGAIARIALQEDGIDIAKLLQLRAK